MNHPPSGFSAIRSTFSNRNFAIYVSGNSLSLIGLWVQRLAVGWLAWSLTKSGFWLGAVAFADLFPVFIIGPFAGVYADRYNRVKISLLCQTLALVFAAILYLLTVSGQINIGILFFITLIQGSVTAFHQPTRLSLIHSLVRRENMATAIAITSISFNLARFIGPAIAGAIITSIGVASAFAINALSFLFMIIALLFLRLPPQKTSSREQHVLIDVVNSLRYVISHPKISQILLMMLALAFLCRPIVELFPGFADAVFSRGATGLAILTSAVGLGAILGGIWIAQRGKSGDLMNQVLASIFVSGLMLIVFTATNLFWLATGVMVVIGAAFVTCGVSTQTLIQQGVEEQMRGRILSIWGMVFRGGPAVGALIMGWLSQFFGLSWSVGLGGVLTLISVLLLMWRSSSLMEKQKKLEA